ncbi:MAG TPA: transposase [Gemmataceae bacterium]
MRRRVEADLSLLEPLDTTIRRLEKDIERAARPHFSTELAVLPSTPGVGIVIALTILLEIDTLERFDSRQQFCSYARLCGARQESVGKKVGQGNAKQGNAWLKWAFSEAAVLSAQKDERIGKYLDKLASRLGKAKALSTFSLAKEPSPGRSVPAASRAERDAPFEE